MQTLPSLRPARVTTAPVPTANLSSANTHTTSSGQSINSNYTNANSASALSSRTAPTLKPAVQQRPSKPLPVAKASDASAAHASPALVFLPPPATAPRSPLTPGLTGRHTSAPVPVPAPASAPASATSSSPAAAPASRPMSGVSPAAFAVVGTAPEHLAALCHEFLSALTPATESVVRFRNPLSALLDDLKVVQRAYGGDSARVSSVARVVVTGTSAPDRQSLLAFLWYSSTEAPPDEHDALSEASLTGADGSLFSSTPSVQPLPMASKSRRTRPSSFRSSTGTVNGPPRVQLGLLPFSASSASLRFTSPTTPPPSGSAGFSYDQRLLYSPTDTTISAGGFPSSCESSQVYPSTFTADKEGGSWILASPQLEMVQLFTPTSPSRSPMSSSLQLPAAPLNTKVRVAAPRQAIGGKDDLLLPPASSQVSSSANSATLRKSEPGGVGSLVQRFTAGINRFTHHQRVLSTDTDASSASPPLGPVSHPLVDARDVDSPASAQHTPSPCYPPSPSLFAQGGRGQSLLFGESASTPRASGGTAGGGAWLATDSDGAAWEGLLEMPRPRVDTLPAALPEQVSLATRTPAPCTAHLVGAARGSGTTDAGGSRRTSSARSRPRRRTICIQTGAFDVTAADLETAAAGASRGTQPPSQRRASPCREGPVGPVPSWEPTPHGRPVSASSGRGGRASSVHVTTPDGVPHTVWLLQEQEHAVRRPPAVSPSSPPPLNGHADAPGATSTPTTFTGDAYLFCVPTADVGRPALHLALQPLFGLTPADTTAVANKAPSSSSPLLVPRASLPGAAAHSTVLVPTPPASLPGSSTTTASLGTPAARHPSATFQRQLASPAPPAPIATADPSADRLRAARQLTASQTFFVLTGVEAVRKGAAPRHTRASEAVPRLEDLVDATTGTRQPSAPQTEEAAASPDPPPLAYSLDNLVELFCAQVQSLYGVTVGRWQVIPFSAAEGIAARDVLTAYHNRHHHEADDVSRSVSRPSADDAAPRPNSASLSPPVIVSVQPSPPHASRARTAGASRTHRRVGPAGDEQSGRRMSQSGEPEDSAAAVGARSPASHGASSQSAMPLATSSPSPVAFGASILKKPGQSSTDGGSPLPSSVNRRIASFRGDFFLDAETTDDELTFDKETSDGGDGWHDGMSLSSTSAQAAGPVPPPLRLSTTPPLLTQAPTAVFSLDAPRGVDAVAQAVVLPPWRQACPPLDEAVSRFCATVYDEAFAVRATDARLSSEDLAQMVYQHITADLWHSCGAARLSAVVKAFEKVAPSYLLSHVTVSLLAWAGQLRAALPEAIGHAETYKAKLQQRLQAHAERRSRLMQTIEYHEAQLSPSLTVARMRSALEAAFREMAAAFARDLRVMLVLQAPPQEMTRHSSPGLVAAVARLAEQVRVFRDWYDVGAWETARAEALAKLRAAQARARGTSRAASVDGDTDSSTTTNPTTIAALAAARLELERQAVTRLSQLNTEIVNVFMQYCAARLPTLKETACEEMRRVRTAYESLLSQLAVIPGARRWVPLSSTRHALRGWRQQLSLLSLPTRARLEPFVTMLRSTLCEDQVRGLARVYASAASACSSSAPQSRAATTLPRAHSHIVVPTPPLAATGSGTRARNSAVAASAPRPGRAVMAAAAAAPHAPPLTPVAELADTTTAAPSLTMAACFGGGAAYEVAQRCRRLLARPRYRQPTATGAAGDRRGEEDAHALALEFSLCGAQSLRRGPRSLGTSVRGGGGSPAADASFASPVQARPGTRRGSPALSAFPASFLAKVPSEASARLSPPPAPAVAPDTDAVPGVSTPPPASPVGPSSSFLDALAAWRRAVPADQRPPANWSAAPLLFLVLDTWDELLLAGSIHAWVHYYEADYTAAANAVASEMLAAQKEWLQRLDATDDTIAEHVQLVNAEMTRLRGTSGCDSVPVALDKVCAQCVSIGEELAASRRTYWSALLS